ncbi:MAG: pilus assembly protein [Pirellula sp.]|jgi:hypothetical protein|nr:pilus assembly protein [Pirellula sp.]
MTHTNVRVGLSLRGPKRIPRISKTPGTRSGAALVELAVCLVPFFAVIFCTLELCETIYTRQSALVVAYEGVRMKSIKNCPTERAKSICEQMMRDRRMVNASIEFRFPDGEQTGRIFEVHVNCRAQNLRLPYSLADRNLSVARFGVLQ